MKLIILKNNLKNALDLVGYAIGNNTNLPVISNVLIKTDGNKLKLVSTNLEVGISCGAAAKIIEDGSISVPYGVVSNIINNISNERINLETKNTNLIINTDNYEATIQGINESEFPIIPKIKSENKYIEINQEELRGSLKKIIIAVGVSELRPEINGILFTAESNIIKIAATDSFRLAEAKIGSGQFKNHLEEGVRVIIPLKTAEILLKIPKGDSDDIVFYFDENQLVARSNSCEVVSRTIDGKFPDYEAILPKSLDNEITMEREELVNALKLASSFTSKIKDVKIKTKGGKTLEVYSSDNSLGENKYLIPAKTTGGDSEITFNLKYFLEGVKAEDSDQIVLGVNSDNKPTLIKTPNSSSYFYILMPVKA